jgi:ribosomal protein S6--L-glutamate ligase
VRFGVYPIPGRRDVEITCSAPVVGRREVTSSNGRRENRFVIATTVRINGRDWPIDVTLTNRESMSTRMLLGRQAIREDIFVDPTASFRQPKLSYRPYSHVPRRDPVRRPLRIGVLTRRADAPGNERLAQAAAARGHVLELIEAGAVSLTFEHGLAGLARQDEALPHYDAVISRLRGNPPAAAALVRQLELMGSYALNPGDALERLRSGVGIVQALVRAGLEPPLRRIAPAAADDAFTFAATASDRQRLLVLGGAVVAAIEIRRGRARAMSGCGPKALQRTAARAARALRLGLAAVDLDSTTGARVVAVSAVPAIAQFERLTGAGLSEPIIAYVESHVRSWVRHGEAASLQSGAEQP